MYEWVWSHKWAWLDLVDKEVLFPGLDGAKPVLTKSTDDAQDVHLGLTLEHGL